MLVFTIHICLTESRNHLVSPASTHSKSSSSTPIASRCTVHWMNITNIWSTISQSIKWVVLKFVILCDGIFTEFSIHRCVQVLFWWTQHAEVSWMTMHSRKHWNKDESEPLRLMCTRMNLAMSIRYEIFSLQEFNSTYTQKSLFLLVGSTERCAKSNRYATCCLLQWAGNNWTSWDGCKWNQKSDRWQYSRVFTKLCEQRIL